jgi:hypothetical protein
MSHCLSLFSILPSITPTRFPLYTLYFIHTLYLTILLVFTGALNLEFSVTFHQVRPRQSRRQT